MTIAQSFAAYSAWRSQLLSEIDAFRDWLGDHGLSDAQIDLNLQHVGDQLREDRLNVAFVAEFSRGKSELINAIFFAEYGSRMLPSTAGRTTMCPTELYFDPSRPPALELLPIETRSAKGSVSEYKRFGEEWRRTALDLTSATAMQEAMRQVSEVKRVSRETAETLGFPVGDSEESAFHVDSDGLVEVPRWRHALINFPHPLLKQGLVILDTPGLNAIGTEPELTLSLLPNAHAVLFILAADTGVTQSDLNIWKDYIAPNRSRHPAQLVALNKIDGLWDELKTEAAISAEIERQVRTSARLLDIPEDQVFAVSAHKGLVGKIQRDEALLARSQLPALEAALSQRLIPAKHQIVRERTEQGFGLAYQQIHALLHSRLVNLREQLQELTELRGKNAGVVEYMVGKVRTEKEEFDSGLQRFYAVRSIFSTLTNNLFGHIGLDAVRLQTQTTREAMTEARFSRQLSDAMRDYFAANRERLSRAGQEVSEILAMMEAIYKKFAVEHGLRLAAPTPFSLFRYEKEMERLEQWCDTHLNTVFQLLVHEKGNLTDKFFEEVAVQVRRAFEYANKDVESWLKAIMAPMETQVREHQIQLKRRLESIKRIHQATETLEERIGELRHVESDLTTQIAALEAQAQRLRDVLEQRSDDWQTAAKTAA